MPGVNDIPKFLEAMSLLVGARWRGSVCVRAGRVAAAVVAARKYAHHQAHQ